jgi:signal transduction histidine kinase
MFLQATEAGIALQYTPSIRFLLEIQRCQLLADRQKLLLVVFNLLSNALRYTKSGGIITIKSYVTIPHSDPNNNTECNHSTNCSTNNLLPLLPMLRIEVKDTGIGMTTVIFIKVGVGSIYTN